MKARSRRDICTPMFSAALFTIAKTWKQFKRPLMDDRISKMWTTQTMEYYSALEKEILQYVTAWLKLEEIMLSEISQSQKDKYYIIHPYEI